MLSYFSYIWPMVVYLQLKEKKKGCSQSLCENALDL